MLFKITKLQNIGLFQNGAPTPVTFDRVTLLYAENGRGKSTVSGTLRACSLGDADGILAKKTLDSKGDPEVSLLFRVGAAITPVEFAKGSWNSRVPNLVVFDSEFVEQNVYSGHEVRSDQRQALLEFALGDKAVALKLQISDLTKKIDAATRRRSEAEKVVGRFSRQTQLAKFIQVSPVPDAQKQIDGIRKRIEAAKNVQTLAQRQDPTPLVSIEFDSGAFFAILLKKLANVQQEAEAVVREHFSKHATPSGVEDWVGRGQQFSKTDACPFCGQNISGLSLIAAYEGYFNEAYSELKQQVAQLKRGAEARLADSKIDGLQAAITTNAARIEAWKDQIDVVAVTIATEPLRQTIRDARERAVELATRKQGQPLEAIGTQADREAIDQAIGNINDAVKNYNNRLDVELGKIGAFKKKLSSENIPALEEQIRGLDLAIARYHVDAVKAIGDYQQAESDRKSLDGNKTATRTHLDQLMATTLAQYQARINSLLGKFGAGFTIEQMRPNYQGSGEPRTEYVLQLRQQSVKLGSRTDTGPHFGSTLSEGDKRTLAFAFFLARIEANAASIGDQILVLDDPVSSLDRNRRAQTIELISNLASKCAQILVFSHDAYFLREMREKLGSAKPTPIASRVIGIGRVQHDYSAFGNCDIDDLCASDYYRHHCNVSDFVSGVYKGNIRDVAKALRPMMEGFYHRRFPRMLPPRCMFGQIISTIASAPAGSPLRNLHPSLHEMGEVNEYASKFHHDTNPGSADTVPVTDGELKSYALRALNLIYKG
jgi:wobble nucleotide-excising tRNase